MDTLSYFCFQVSCFMLKNFNYIYIYSKYSLHYRHIGLRLNKINEHIEQLSKTEDCGLRCKWKKSYVLNGYVQNTRKNRNHILWIIM